MVELFDSLSDRTSFTHFSAVLITFCSRPEAAIKVISGSFVGRMILDTRSKFRGSSLNRSRKSPPESLEVIFSSFFRYNFRPDVGNDVISGEAVNNVGLDASVKFGCSRSNGFRDIRRSEQHICVLKRVVWPPPSSLNC